MTVETYHSICQWLRALTHGTQWEGHVYAVGGCCRDEVMGREINDIDLAVDLENGGVEFARWLHSNGHTTTAPTVFERYGTAMLNLREWPGHEIEIVQTRRGKYTAENATDPGSVFGTIADDARRRDFTVNSLFYNISSGELLDLTGHGLDDIAAHRLRTPMDAALTFYDDPVRILRCIRMACAWRWKIDTPTITAMRQGIAGLKAIKPERRRAEFEKMLTGPDPARALGLLRSTGAMRFLVPELENCYRIPPPGDSQHSLWEQALRAVQSTPADADASVKYAALMHVFAHFVTKARRNSDPNNQHAERAIAAARIAEAALRRLKYHGQFVKETTFLVRNHNSMATWGTNAEFVKDRNLTRLKHLCVTDRRLERLLTVIHAINVSAPQPLAKPHQIPLIRQRLNS